MSDKNSGGGLNSPLPLFLKLSLDFKPTTSIMLFVMINYLKEINAFLAEKNEVKNVEIITLAITGIVLGLVLADLADALRTRRANKAKEATR